MITADRTENAERIHCCDKCSGRGTYDKRGVCFQCEGKGYMTPADDKRCEFYWARRFAAMVASDCRQAG